jgi:hypothetical protein
MKNHKRDINHKNAMDPSGYAVFTVESDDLASVASLGVDLNDGMVERHGEWPSNAVNSMHYS